MLACDAAAAAFCGGVRRRRRGEGSSSLEPRRRPLLIGRGADRGTPPDDGMVRFRRRGALLLTSAVFLLKCRYESSLLECENAAA